VSREFHLANPTYSKLLFGGFDKFEELLTFIHILFPLIDVSTQYLESVKIISTTHKILIFLMKTAGGLERHIIGAAFGVSTKHIGDIILQIAPYMGAKAKDLTILDFDREYLDREEPDCYKEYRQKKDIDMILLMDGKAYPTGTARSSSLMMKMTWCNKIVGEAFQV